MTWIALSDFENPTFNMNGVGAAQSATSYKTDVLAKGTILLEATVSPCATDHVLLDYRCGGDWPFRLNIQKAPDGTFWVYIDQSAGQSHLHAVQTDFSQFGGTVQVQYAWDGPKRMGQLSITAPRTGQTFATRLDAPCALPLKAVADMTLNANGGLYSQTTRFFAISDEIEPVGVAASIGPGAFIDTRSGVLPLSQLHQGMTVNCSRYGPQIVDWVQSHVRPAAGSTLPVRLLAPFLGLQQDVIVAADQRVAMGGPDVEYLFGEETVLVQAKDLIHGPMARIETGLRTVTYHQVYLERHALIAINGCKMESLYLSECAKAGLEVLDPAHPFSDLANLPSHQKLARPSLRGFEAMTLNKVLVA